jgi:hypothetical protein
MVLPALPLPVLLGPGPANLLEVPAHARKNQAQPPRGRMAYRHQAHAAVLPGP